MRTESILELKKYMAQRQDLPHFEGDKYKTDEENLEHLKDFILRLRGRVFYDPRQAADYTGLSRSTITRYENGNIKKPHYGYMVALAEQLGESAAYRAEEKLEVQKVLTQELNNIVKCCPGYADEPLYFKWEELQRGAREYLSRVQSRRTYETTLPVAPPHLEDKEELPDIHETAFIETGKPDQPVSVLKRQKRFLSLVIILTLLTTVISLIFLLLTDKSPAAENSVTLGSNLGPSNSQELIIPGNLELSRTVVTNDGQVITATFRIVNSSSHPIFIRELVAAARGPDACKLGWDAPVANFPPVKNLTLQPGENYLYSGARSFDLPGYYFVEPVINATEDKLKEILPFSRSGFKIIDAQTKVSLEPDCVLDEDGLNLSSASVITGQPITISFTGKNNGSMPLVIRQLTAIVHGGDKLNSNDPPRYFPPVIGLVLSPGGKYEYRQSKKFDKPGSYWVEIAYSDKTGHWNSVWPYNRLQFEVVQGT